MAYDRQLWVVALTYCSLQPTGVVRGFCLCVAGWAVEWVEVIMIRVQIYMAEILGKLTENVSKID
jgi:hypothetical protein